mmetsp:Transcript_26219/g.77847  ORF Transcript_26219/g.77847 Transcript_26219/m.77847 type:complete len:158 (-) Transcript_26219:1162-1635(-)
MSALAHTISACGQTCSPFPLPPLYPILDRYKPRGEMGGGPGGSMPLGASAGMVSRTGKIDWGHLAGDNRLYVGDHKGEYKMLEEALPPPPPLPAPGAQAAPLTMAPSAPLPPPPAAPRTVEEALAIIEQYNSQKKKRCGGQSASPRANANANTNKQA